MVAMMRCFGTKHQKHFILLSEGGRNDFDTNVGTGPEVRKKAGQSISQKETKGTKIFDVSRRVRLKAFYAAKSAAASRSATWQPRRSYVVYHPVAGFVPRQFAPPERPMVYWFVCVFGVAGLASVTNPCSNF